MPMNPSTWGPTVAAAVKAVGVSAGTPITDAQLQAIWTAIVTAHDTHISGNAQVTVTGVTPGSGSATGTVT